MSPGIISECLEKYFVEGVPVEETLRGCDDIKKFLTFQKVGKQFEIRYGNKPCRHINRYYVSMDGEHLQKIDNDGKIIDLCADSGVTLFNVLKDIKPKDAHINYTHYRRRIMDYIEPMTHRQLTLF